MANQYLNFVSDDGPGPQFQPVFVTDHKIVNNDLRFTNKPIEYAIDDFFNCDEGIVLDNRGKFSGQDNCEWETQRAAEDRRRN